MKSRYFVLIIFLIFVSLIFIYGCGNVTGGGGGGGTSGTTNPLSHISTVDSIGTTCFSLALDSTGKPRILYHVSTAWKVYYSKWNGSTWEEIANWPAYSYGASMALSNSDASFMLIYNGSGDLEIGQNDGASWSTLDTTTNLSAYGGNSVAIDQDGDPHFSYYNQSDSSLRYAKLKNTWTLLTVEADGDVGKYSCITINNNGSPEISYYDDTNDLVKCAMWTGVTWEITTVEASSDPVRSTSIAVDSTGRTYVAYMASNQLMCATYEASNGWIANPVDTSPTSGQYVSIKIDSNQIPWIAYAQGNGLWYASWEGTSWILTSVEAGSSVGGACSLAMSSSNEPRICYYGGSGSGLKYYWK